MECLPNAISDLAQTESTERMEAQKSRVVEHFLEVPCKQTGPGEAGISLLSPRCNLPSWLLSDSDKVLLINTLDRRGPAALLALVGGSEARENVGTQCSYVRDNAAWLWKAQFQLNRLGFAS